MSLGLTAPEAFVLLKGRQAKGAASLKLALTQLLVQRHLRAERRERVRKWLRHRFVSITAATPARPLPKHLAVVLEAVRKVHGSDGELRRIVRELTRVCSGNIQRYNRLYVEHDLVERGLLVEKVTVVLGIITVSRCERTAAGERCAARITELMAEARGVPALLERDPAQAAALAVALGSAILLVEELRPYLSEIAETVRNRNGDGGPDGLSLSGGEPSRDNDRDVGTTDLSGFDLGAFDSDLFADIDFGLDDLAASFDGATGSDGGDGTGGGSD